jgi:exonuclease VII small subunit
MSERPKEADPEKVERLLNALEKADVSLDEAIHFFEGSQGRTRFDESRRYIEDFRESIDVVIDDSSESILIPEQKLKPLQAKLDRLLELVQREGKSINDTLAEAEKRRKKGQPQHVFLTPPSNQVDASQILSSLELHCMILADLVGMNAYNNARKIGYDDKEANIATSDMRKFPVLIEKGANGSKRLVVQLVESNELIDLHDEKAKDYTQWLKKTVAGQVSEDFTEIPMDVDFLSKLPQVELRTPSVYEGLWHEAVLETIEGIKLKASYRADTDGPLYIQPLHKLEAEQLFEQKYEAL